MYQSVQYLSITEDEAGQRLDNYLLRCLKGVPKSLIYRVIRKGEVRVNKGRVKPERRLQAGDSVRVPPLRVADEKVISAPGAGLIRHLEASVILEKPSYLVVNKPAGLAVHGGSGVNLGLIEALRQMWPQQKYLELVHRLDRETSGCILVAKKRKTLKHFQSLFRGEKQIRKTYLALVQGVWPKSQVQVMAPLQRFELPTGDRIVKVRADGKAAKTNFSVKQTFGKLASLLQVEPLTGRTHQIRVHSQYQGHPLVGDNKYGDDEFNARMKDFGSKRLFLHAQALSFIDDDNEKQRVEAPLSDDLCAVLEALKKELL